MKEISSLLQRSKRYLKSAELLLNEGDYESSVLKIYYKIFQIMAALKNYKVFKNRKIYSLKI